MTVWQRIYDSPWQQPRLVMLLGALALAAVARWKLTAGSGRSPFFTAWLLFFGVEALVDARLTAPDSPLLPEHAGVVGALAIAFVILGDARFYVLVERFTREPTDGARGAPIATRSVLAGLAWGSVASLVMAPLARTVPVFVANPRAIFLAYELVALAQATLWLKVVVPRRLARIAPPSPAVERWLREAARFVVAQYALWALADVTILWLHPAGYLARVVPNVLYYGLFVGYVFLRAPPALRPRSRTDAPRGV